MAKKYIFTTHLVPFGQSDTISAPLNEDHDGPEWELMFRPKEEVIPAKPSPVVLVTCIWGKREPSVVVEPPAWLPLPPLDLASVPRVGGNVPGAEASVEFGNGNEE